VIPNIFCHHILFTHFGVFFPACPHQNLINIRFWCIFLIRVCFGVSLNDFPTLSFICDFFPPYFLSGYFFLILFMLYRFPMVDFFAAKVVYFYRCEELCNARCFAMQCNVFTMHNNAFAMQCICNAMEFVFDAIQWVCNAVQCVCMDSNNSHTPTFWCAHIFTCSLWELRAVRCSQEVLPCRSCGLYFHKFLVPAEFVTPRKL